MFKITSVTPIHSQPQVSHLIGYYLYDVLLYLCMLRVKRAVIFACFPLNACFFFVHIFQSVCTSKSIRFNGRQCRTHDGTQKMYRASSSIERKSLNTDNLLNFPVFFSSLFVCRELLFSCGFRCVLFNTPPACLFDTFFTSCQSQSCSPSKQFSPLTFLRVSYPQFKISKR